MNRSRYSVILTVGLMVLTACGGGAAQPTVAPAKPTESAAKPATSPAAAGSPASAASPSASPAAGAGAAAAKPSGPAPKVAMVMPGPIQDGDFNALGAQALEEIKRQIGSETAFSESVAVADAERVGREYLNSGYDIVIFHGAQFITIAQKLGPAFPDKSFALVSSAKPGDLPPNVWNVDRKLHRGFYALGVLAASSTQSNKIGYVSGVRLPDFIAALNAVKQAVQDTKPAVQVVSAFVGDQNDPVKAREATASQISSGVDFVVATVNLGINGVAEAAKASARPVFFTTFYTEKRELAPDRLGVSLVVDFATPYLEVVRGTMGGTRGGYLEMKPGAGLKLSEISNTPPDAATKARDAFAAVAAGTKDVPEISDRIVGE